jgi:Mg/Co/Ni transporter MgtE
MSAEPLYAYEDDPVEQALDRMRSAQVRRLMVIDRDGQLVGVVSLGDVATKAPHKTETAAALEDISTPSKPDRPARATRSRKKSR